MSRATRKRRLLNPRKAQLLFVEQPRSGSRHDYGAQLRSAINPRSFISEQSRQDVPVHSWVSPQFSSLEDNTVGCDRQRRRKNQLQDKSGSTLNRTVSTQFRRTTVCKYPALLFDSSNSVPLRLHRGLGKSNVGNSAEIRPPESRSDQTSSPVMPEAMPRSASLNVRRLNVSSSGAKGTPVHSCSSAEKTPTPSSVTTHTAIPSTSRILTPPHIETPEVPRCKHPASSPIPNILFSSNQPRTPPRTENLLVRDTPECDYGLKVTWRRRKKLMRLLAERGQLPHTQILVSNNFPKDV